MEQVSFIAESQGSALKNVRPIYLVSRWNAAPSRLEASYSTYLSCHMRTVLNY